MYIHVFEMLLFSSPEPKAHGELIVYQSSRRLCICLYVCKSTLSNMIISETSWPIATKFNLKQHWGGGKAALGSGPDQIGTLVSMAMGSSKTLSNMNISKTSWPIATIFYLKHHLGRGKAALGFGPDQIGTLFSMAMDSSHRVIMGKKL